jgi:hypothetical protein
MVWFVAYRHSLRPDEAGVKFVHDQSEAAAEKQDLESRGYVVARVAPSPHASAGADPAHPHPHQPDPIDAIDYVATDGTGTPQPPPPNQHPPAQAPPRGRVANRPKSVIHCHRRR